MKSKTPHFFTGLLLLFWYHILLFCFVLLFGVPDLYLPLVTTDLRNNRSTITIKSNTSRQFLYTACDVCTTPPCNRPKKCFLYPRYTKILPSTPPIKPPSERHVNLVGCCSRPVRRFSTAHTRHTHKTVGAGLNVISCVLSNAPIMFFSVDYVQYPYCLKKNSRPNTSHRTDRGMQKATMNSSLEQPQAHCR